MPARRPALPTTELGGVLAFMRLLWSVDHGLQATSKRMQATLGVTGPQRLAVRIIGRFPGIAAGRLASILQVHPSTLTGILSRLESRRLVTRSADPDDKRRALFGLTGAGRALNERRSGTVEAALSRALAALPASQVQASEQVLLAVIRALGVELERDGDVGGAR
ncbi:MAG: MarR family transcriptional regulator [Myxococcales bacterium]|nr:MarR family transcriptional regulator [Myxococcales bacterium]